ncbi:MAG: hypothetical protein K6A30_05235 [Lachnospiraceae bacterium]|nr:hypothetical protein [Lachnospiraceae bacterium]
MKWYKHLYVGPSLQEKKEKVIRNLRRNVLQVEVYVIVLADNGKDNFRIIHSLELLQKPYPKDELTVVGIAGGKEEAFFLVEDMVKDVLKETGSVEHISSYFGAKGGL